MNIILALFGVSAAAYGAAFVSGYQVNIGIGDSMQPTMSNPSLMIVNRKFDKLNEGDIVVHNGINHRVVKLTEDEVVTKGDNNEYPEPAVPRSDVTGKVVTYFNHPFS